MATNEDISSNFPKTCDDYTKMKEIIDSYDKAPPVDRFCLNDAFNTTFVNLNRKITKGYSVDEDASMLRMHRAKLAIWRDIDLNWNYYQQDVQRFRAYFYMYGIPDTLRKTIWKNLVVGKSPPTDLCEIYETIKADARKNMIDADCIDRDIHRVFGHNILFNGNHCAKRVELFNVLLACSTFDRKLGFFQPVSNIAATLLMYLNEEDSFWCLIGILKGDHYNIRKFLLEETEGFAIEMVNILKHLIETFLPRLFNHFKSMEFNYNFTIHWFRTCQLLSFHSEAALRIFDLFLLEGFSILLPVAMTIFDLYELDFLKLDSEFDVNQFDIKSRVVDDKDILNFMKLLRKNIWKIKESGKFPVDITSPSTSISKRYILFVHENPSRHPPQIDENTSEEKKQTLPSSESIIKATTTDIAEEMISNPAAPRKAKFTSNVCGCCLPNLWNKSIRKL